MGQIEQFENTAQGYVTRCKVNLWSDTARDPRFELHIAQVGSQPGETTERIVMDGACYTFFQVDYIDREDAATTLAKRMFALIEAGHRTELAYWKPEAPTKQLMIHQGVGQLLVARVASRGLQSHELSPSRPEVTLPPDSFYSFVADRSSPDPLVVSGFYEAPFEDWSNLEVAFPPEVASLMSDGEEIVIPPAFSKIFQ